MAAERQLTTVEYFDQWVEQPENLHQLFEYIGGEIVEVPSNPYSSILASRFARYLVAFVDDNALGYVTGEAGGYQVAGERYAPDVAYLSKARQSELVRTGYNPNPPDLAVEIVSPSDKSRDLRIKITNYLNVGTTVWLVDPESKSVEIYQPGQPVEIVHIGDILNGGSVLPGFELPLINIFRD